MPAEMRREVLRLHRSLAHLPAIDLARIMKDAGARLDVIEWTKKFFKCPVCESRQKPGLPRSSSARHTWEFNKVVGLDHFHHTFKHTPRDFLNLLCWGTNRQNVILAEDLTAIGTRRRFLTHWCDHYGLPDLVVVDQGSEFKGDEFRLFFQSNGVLVHFRRLQPLAERTNRTGRRHLQGTVGTGAQRFLH